MKITLTVKVAPEELPELAERMQIYPTKPQPMGLPDSASFSALKKMLSDLGLGD